MRCHSRRVAILSLIEKGAYPWEIAKKLGIKEKSLMSNIYRYRDAGLVHWNPETMRWELTELGKRYLEECRRRGVG